MEGKTEGLKEEQVHQCRDGLCFVLRVVRASAESIYYLLVLLVLLPCTVLRVHSAGWLPPASVACGKAGPGGDSGGRHLLSR